MKEDSPLFLLLGVGLVGFGVYTLMKGTPPPINQPIWKVGDKMRLYFMPLVEAHVQVAGVSWSSLYNQWQYLFFDLDTNMQYGDWYLESQVVQWYAGPIV